MCRSVRGDSAGGITLCRAGQFPLGLRRTSNDGGLTILMGAFLSLVQHCVTAKVVVFNNGALGFIELEQKSTGFPDFGSSRIRISRQWPKRLVHAPADSERRSGLRW